MQATASNQRAADAAGHLRRRLRAETGAAHAELERALDIVGRVSDRQRTLRVMERFLGFHIVWERAIRQHTEVRAFHEPRSRLPHLRRDLAALGLTNAEQSALPACAAAAGLARTRGEALGSIYVMEGSTLGGQVISRALAGAGWAPPGGLTYFDPYRGRTGEMWRAFGAWADAFARPDEHAAAIAGAGRTFALLRSWLTS